MIKRTLKKKKKPFNWKFYNWNDFSSYRSHTSGFRQWKVLKTHRTPAFMPFPSAEWECGSHVSPVSRILYSLFFLAHCPSCPVCCGLVWCHNCYFWHVPVDTGHSYNQSNRVSPWEGDRYPYHDNWNVAASEEATFRVSLAARATSVTGECRADRGGRGWQQPL